MRRLVTASLVLSAVITPVVLVAPVVANPFAAKPRPVKTHAAEVVLGDVDRPAKGATRQQGVPSGVPLSPEATAAQRKSTARGATPTGQLRSVRAQRAGTASFSAVGVTWKREASVGSVSVAVRVKDSAGKWGQWTATSQEESGVNRPTTRGGSDLVWTGPAEAVEVVVTAVTGSAPRDLRVQLIDPGTSAADANPSAGQPAARANAGLIMPTIYRRAAWGADESKMTWDPYYAPRLKAATLHHTVNTNNYTSSQVPAMLRAIYHYHAVSNDWGDIGYNAVVDRFGRLWEGRYGGLSRAVVGAHAGGFNYATTGIAMLGNFSSVDPPWSAREMAARYIAWKFSLYGINPTAYTQLRGGNNTKYSSIVTITVPTVFPHRLTSNTSCPGEGGMRALPWIRNRAKALMGAWASSTSLRTRPMNFDPSTATWYRLYGTSMRYGVAGDIPVPGDWNGDTTTDLGVYRNGMWYSPGRVASNYGLKGDVPVPGYYNDGPAVNRSVWRPSTGMWYVEGRTAVKLGKLGDIPVPADYNGDGRTDMAVYTPATSTWTIQGKAPFVYGQPDDVPVPADYNGDDIAEVGVWRPSNGTWYVPNRTPVQYGGRGDRPMPYLWNNDRTADMAVWRSSTRTWHVRTTWSVSSPWVWQLGTSNSIPRATDW